MRRRTLALSGIALVATLALGLFGLPRGDGPASDRSDDTAERGAAETPGLSPGTTAQRAAGKVPDAAATWEEKEEPAPAPTPRPTFRVRGRVRDEKGVVPARTFVTVAEYGGMQRYLGRAKPADDGTFEVTAPVPDGPGPWTVNVRAWAEGRGAAEESPQVSTDSIAEVELRFVEGLRVHGRVVDESGKGLAGLPFALLDSASGAWSVDTPDPRTDESAHTGWGRTVARGVTGEDGAFAVDGLTEDTYGLVSADAAWWLETPGERAAALRPADEPVRVTARPAYRFEAVLVPARPAEDPLASWTHPSVAFDIEGGDSWSAGVIPGRRFVQRGAVPDDKRNGFRAQVRVDTSAHVPITTELAFGPGAWTHRLRFELERIPASQTGTVVFESGLRDAAGRPVPYRVLAWRETRPRHLSGEWLTLTPRDDGTLAARLVAGSRGVQVQADSRPADLLVWKGSIDVKAGAETRFRIPWPPSGRVRLRLPRDPAYATGSLHVSVATGDARRFGHWSGTVAADEIADLLVLAGDAEATWYPQAGVAGKPALHARFTVPAGGEVVADLVP